MFARRCKCRNMLNISNFNQTIQFSKAFFTSVRLKCQTNFYMMCKERIQTRYNQIKGSLSSSWMNSPIASLLASVAKQVFVQNVTCTFIHMKIKSFSCETFSTSTRSKEANGNSEVEVKSACIYMCQAAHQASTYSNFCSM